MPLAHVPAELTITKQNLRQLYNLYRSACSKRYYGCSIGLRTVGTVFNLGCFLSHNHLNFESCKGHQSDTESKIVVLLKVQIELKPSQARSHGVPAPIAKVPALTVALTVALGHVSKKSPSLLDRA